MVRLNCGFRFYSFESAKHVENLLYGYRWTVYTINKYNVLLSHRRHHTTCFSYGLLFHFKKYIYETTIQPNHVYGLHLEDKSIYNKIKSCGFHENELQKRTFNFVDPWLWKNKEHTCNVYGSKYSPRNIILVKRKWHKCWICSIFQQVRIL